MHSPNSLPQLPEQTCTYSLLASLPTVSWNASPPPPLPLPRHRLACPRLIPPPPLPWDPINQPPLPLASFFQLTLSHRLTRPNPSCLQGGKDPLDPSVPSSSCLHHFCLHSPLLRGLLSHGSLFSSLLSGFCLPLNHSFRAQSSDPRDSFRAFSSLPFLSHLVLWTNSSLKHLLSVISRTPLFPDFSTSSLAHHAQTPLGSLPSSDFQKKIYNSTITHTEKITDHKFTD